MESSLYERVQYMNMGRKRAICGISGFFAGEVAHAVAAIDNRIAYEPTSPTTLTVSVVAGIVLALSAPKNPDEV